MEEKSYVIRIENGGQSFFCREDQPVLEAMKHSGRGPLYYGYFGGGCGICKMRIVSGEYCVTQKMSRAHVSAEEQSQGIVLLCCVEPRGNLVLSRL